MKRKLMLGLLGLCCLGQTIAVIFAFAKVHRLETEQSKVWLEGYQEGVNRALQASQQQFKNIASSGVMDQPAMQRFVWDGFTNNPYGTNAWRGLR